MLEEHERLVPVGSVDLHSHVDCACLDGFSTAQDHRRHVVAQMRAATVRRRVVDDSLLKSVAKVWRSAPEGARRRAVAEEFDCSGASAGSYIAKARARGFIPPTEKRAR